MKKYIIIFSLLFSFVFFCNLNGSKTGQKTIKFVEETKPFKPKENKKELHKKRELKHKNRNIIGRTEEENECFSSMEQEKQMECEEVKTQSNDEQRIIDELSCMNAFQNLATKMALLPQTEFMYLKNFFTELKEIHESWSKEFGQAFLMQETEFPFCIGLIAFYLSDELEIKEWFQKLFEKEMNRKEGIELIKQSPGEQAYWFIEGLSAECYNGNE